MTDESNKRERAFKRSNKLKASSLDELSEMSNEELIEKVIQLEAYNVQLKNILHRKCKEEINELQNESKKKFDFTSVTRRHVLIKLLYFGWDCQGYTVQDDTINTIEFHLFKALERCCLIEKRETSNYHRCGRTDKGVSAFCQVISIDLRSKLLTPNAANCNSELPYCTMLNRLLPDYIRCYAWSHVDHNASARFDCSSRTYQYYFPKGQLNIVLMEEGVKHLLGEHDFRNFCKMDIGNGVTEFIRTIKSADIKSCDSNVEESGNGFLWHQIRCIMGVLFLIGQGKEQPGVIEQLLDISKNPAKPQYSMANQVPLNLFDSEYENLEISWNVNDKEIVQIIRILQKQWTFQHVKGVMIREVIEELSKLIQEPVNICHQADPLLDGAVPRVYRPLLSRMKCETLENRIEHYVKRRKLIREN